MLANNLTPVLHAMFLALTPSERWSAAGSPLEHSFTMTQWLSALAVLAQIVSIIIVLCVIAQKRRLEHTRTQENARFTSMQESLQREIDRLAASNKTLQQQISELIQESPAEASEQIGALHGSVEPGDQFS